MFLLDIPPTHVLDDSEEAPAVKAQNLAYEVSGPHCPRIVSMLVPTVLACSRCSSRSKTPRMDSEIVSPKQTWQRASTR